MRWAGLRDAARAVPVLAPPIRPGGPGRSGRPTGQAGQADQGSQVGTQPQSAQPVFRTGINFVRVDAIITDKQGNPVTDLTQADFDVTEDGKPQAIETFRLIKVSGEPEPGGERPREIRSDFDQESEAQRDDVRVFAIFLDDYHVRRGASMSVREPLIRFIRNSLGPLDMVALMYPLMPVTLLSFTRNHESIIKEIERFDGRKFDYKPRNEFEEKYSQYPAEVVERVRNQVSLSALEGLMVKLGRAARGPQVGHPGQRGLHELPAAAVARPGGRNAGPRQHWRGVAPGAGDNSVGEERKQFFDDIDIQNYIRDVFNAANKGNTAIYSLDPRGLAVFEYDINEGVGQRTDSAMLQQHDGDPAGAVGADRRPRHRQPQRPRGRLEAGRA